MKLSGKSPNRLSLILATLILTTASIVLANRSGHPTRKPQAIGRHIAPTTTSRSNGFVEDNRARRSSPLALPTPSPTPTPSRIYRVVEVRAAEQRFVTRAGFLEHRFGEQGEVMGYILNDGGGRRSAAIWRNGLLDAIPTPNAFLSEANDINETNQVVGTAEFRLDTPEGVRKRVDPYILPDTALPNPNFVVVQGPSNPSLFVQHAQAIANNNAGQVIGYSQTSPDWEPHGYQALLWDTNVPGNPVTILAPLPGDSGSRPRDINDNGIVVGESGDYDFLTNYETRAVVWKNGRAIDIGKLPGLSRCKAMSINSFDYVVGFCETPPGANQTREGFLWHDDNSNGQSDTGELRTLQPFLPNGPYEYDINDEGQFTAGKFIYSDDNSNGLTDAGETKDLNSLIIDTSYVIDYTREINNRGQILAWGTKRDAQGVNTWSGYVLLDPLEPVIFVPGILGSVLVDDPGGQNKELWPFLAANRWRLTLFPEDGPSEKIEATDAIRYAIPSLRLVQIYEPFFKYLKDVAEFREYVVGDPSKRTTAGCDLTQKRDDPTLSPNFFVFAYDWRKSNVENAAKLQDYVGCVRLFHPDTKINIIAHSMGGLLSRRYILDNPNNHHITRLITVGTPWLGAPKLLRVLETGEFLDVGPIYMSVPEIRYIAPSLIGAHQLLPSLAFQDLGAPPIFVKDGWDYDDSGEKYESYDYDQVRRFLDKKYCPTTPCLRMPGTAGPGTTGDEFHSYRTASDKQDDWRSDSTGVKYFHFYGVQRKNKTIGQIVAKPIIKCRFVPPFFLPFCYPTKDLEPVVTAGDGTVPELSASRKASALDLNAPNARVISVTNNKDALAEHVKMLQNPDVHSAILALLRGGIVSSSISSAARRRSAERRYANHAQDDSPSALSYYVSINGGSSVVVTDTQGNSTAPIDGELMGTLEDVTFFSMRTEATMISLPVSNTEQYTITFNVSDEPLALRIVKGETNVKPTDVIHYEDIVLPAGVSAKLVVSPAGFENLRYDSDGDGTYDASVPPSLVLSGSAALDITAPTLAFTESPQSPTVAQVTITATDIGTGIRDVNYSTDGSQFQAYTSPLSLDPVQTPFISAFATDSAGNRSPIITYRLGSPPIIIRGTVKNHAGNLLSGATITLRGTTSVTARTDTSGNYEFASLPAGGYYGLTASLPGFRFSSDDRVVSNPITDRTVDFVGEGACEVATVTSQPTPQTVCEGSSASFSVTATGTNLSFQWRKNGVPLSNGDNISGADSPTLTINSGGEGDAATYDVVITASCAPSTASNEARLIVVPFTDSDGDGQGDCIDLDDDNDGQKDVDENACGSDPLVASSRSPDIDGDNEPDCVDPDADNDEVPNAEDAFPLIASEWLDTDGDGTGNNSDLDDDRDGLADAIDNCPWVVNVNQEDDDGDLIGNACDPIVNTHIQVVFSSHRRGISDIYGMRVDGTETVRLTTNSGSDFDSALSPDNSKVVFTNDFGGQSRSVNLEIFSMSLQDKKIRRLTTNRVADRSPAWSPDGSKIVFESQRDCTNTNPESGATRVISDGLHRIFVMNEDGSNPQCLSDQIGWEPTWSPDGRKIAFGGPLNGRYRIFSMNPDGTGLKPLTDASRDNWNPTWSPDGSKIAFLSKDGPGNRWIYCMNANGTGVTLLKTLAGVSSLIWGKNNKIAFSAPLGNKLEIYRINVDGRDQRRLTTTSDSKNSPHW